MPLQSMATSSGSTLLIFYIPVFLQDGSFFELSWMCVTLDKKYILLTLVIVFASHAADPTLVHKKHFHANASRAV